MSSRIATKLPAFRALASRDAVNLRLLRWRALCDACALLVADLRQRQAGAGCDDLENGMAWIAWHAQRMHSFPGTNANLGRIQVRALIRQFEPPLLRALILFVRKALGVRVDKLAGGAVRGNLRIVHDHGITLWSGSNCCVSLLATARGCLPAAGGRPVRPQRPAGLVERAIAATARGESPRARKG